MSHNIHTALFIAGVFLSLTILCFRTSLLPWGNTSHIPQDFFLTVFSLVFISLPSTSAKSNPHVSSHLFVRPLLRPHCNCKTHGISLLQPSTSWCLGWQKRRKSQFPQGTHLFLPCPGNSWVDFSQPSFKTLIRSPAICPCRFPCRLFPEHFSQVNNLPSPHLCLLFF